MSILKAEKVIIAGLQSSQEYLLKRLQKEGLVHIETLKESKSQPELTLLRELEEAIKFLSLYEEKKSFFQKVQEVFSLNREDLYKERDFFEESGLVKKMLALKKELLKIREERKNKERELSQIQDFLFFDFSLKNLEFKEISWLVLSEERERIISLLEKGSLKDKPYFLAPLFTKKKKLLFIFFFNRDKGIFLSFFKENKLNLVSLPSILTNYPDKTPYQIKVSLLKEIESLNREEEKKLKEVKNLTLFKNKLIFFYEYTLNSFLREEKKTSLLTTEKTFFVEGWVLSKDREKLKSILKEFREVFFTIREPRKGELPPVKLENPPLIKPFEIVVNMYGAPHPFSLDPTLFLSPFLFMFTGICISDAGYGLVLAGISWLFLKKLKPVGLIKSFLQLISYLGISTFVVGLLLGGVFGLPLRVFQVIDPLKDTFKFLLFCFFLGFIQVLVGMGIKAYLEFKRRKFLGFLVQLFWINLLLVLPLYFKYRIDFLKYLGIISAMGIVGFSSGHKNILVRLAQGLYELYGVSKYFSDILSYSRLVALGLATGVIAMVVNILAQLVFKIPILGIFLGIGVLIIGHSFNIFINLLSGLIHSARLQFVEFFSKFFELGGMFFEPFSYQTKYARIED
ncbi:MAG: hypothetical protein DRP61_01155 [Candidatus Omnitrophota bacterium]|nr:MAG: hypothetical protein DRP61_01155 [Candidatus Omnitrophota bacterium]